MTEGPIHICGSVPPPSAKDVFETLAGSLGPKITNIPDDETGEREHRIM